MKRVFVSLAAILVYSGVASAQTTGKGTIDGLPYVTLTSPDGCTTATPCTILEYLHPLGEQDKAPAQIQRYFNNTGFWSANPHTIVVAPMIPGSSSTNNWGNVQDGINKNMTAAVDLVAQTKSTVPTNGKTTLAGGSMGAIGGELLMALYGPKGSQQAGVYQAGLFYDGAPYTISTAAMKANLCGIPLTIVHSANDHTVSPIPDQNMAKTLSGCAGFQFISIPGLGHGSYSGSDIGLGNPKLITEMMTAAGQAAPAVAATPTAAASPQHAASQPTTPSMAVATANYPASTMMPSQAAAATPAEAVPQSDPDGLQSATLKPDGGTVTVDGHEWEITPDGLITEDGREVYASRGTSDMAFVQNADGSYTVWGKDDGNGPIPGAWFTISSTDPNAQQRWIVSQIPPDLGLASAVSPAASPVGLPAAVQATGAVATSPAQPGSCPVPEAGAAGFRVSGGRINGPNGEFLVRGVNLYSSEADTTDNGKLVIQTFKGVNFIRYIARTLEPPSSYDAFVNKVTPHGVVAEFENHPNGGGGQNLSPPQGMATESGWYAAMAKHFAANPYVWFGTFNEAGTSGSSLSYWQQNTYNAVRSGSDTILLVEVSGVVPAMVPSVFAAMHNIVYDQHIYDNPDPNSLKKIIAYDQTVKSADGVVPVIVGEMGPSVPDGSRMAPNGIATIESLIGIAQAGEMGGLALFTWWPGFANANNLTDPAGNPTVPYGQMAQIYINLDNVPLTDCQLAAGAQQAIADVTAAMASSSGTPK